MTTAMTMPSPNRSEKRHRGRSSHRLGEETKRAKVERIWMEEGGDGKITATALAKQTDCSIPYIRQLAEENGWKFQRGEYTGRPPATHKKERTTPGNRMQDILLALHQDYPHWGAPMLMEQSGATRQQVTATASRFGWTLPNYSTEGENLIRVYHKLHTEIGMCVQDLSYLKKAIEDGQPQAKLLRASDELLEQFQTTLRELRPLSVVDPVK